MKLFTSSLFLVFFLTNTTSESLPKGFIYLNDISPEIVLDLQYFSSDNFVGDTIDGYNAEKCIISMQAALALKRVQNELKSSGYGLKVFDAYRPQQAVDHFVRWAKDHCDTKMKKQFYPQVNKGALFEEGYISSKSGHSRGSTVDLTIIYLDGQQKGNELDMGTPWDFFSPKSWPSSNEVTAQQKANRMLLQKIMSKHGFRPYKAEWWHFTLRGEPFRDKYFNFPVQ